MFLKRNEGSSYVSRLKKGLPQGFVISRAMNANLLEIEKNKTVFGKQEIPIYNPDIMLPFYLGEILGDKFVATTKILDSIKFNTQNLKAVYTQPTDSLLKPMMHRSDNFFAEQSLLMVSNEHLGYMNDAKIIDTLLKTDFKDLPQKPRWADGSGLSRYNLFTPQDFVTILNKIKNEFGMERVKTIFPTGGEGTISSYYKADSGYIYAKTGTLSGVVAFSGFLYTKKGKLLIFSTLVNNHQASATEVRRSVERFIQKLRQMM
jgi:D-alanyl-D-alanine carboxypeptidase/D-alanyl-D-alanine-endopeptidase (penicillin-binding protein 4)